MQKSWERRADENATFFNYFNCYLQNGGDVEKTAEALKKSVTHIRNLAARYEWRERRAVFNESLMEAARADLKQELINKLRLQWRNCDLLQDAALKALLSRDLCKASFKSLNEIYHSAAQLQLKLADELKLFEPNETGEDNNLTIRIVRASKEGAAENV